MSPKTTPSAARTRPPRPGEASWSSSPASLVVRPVSNACRFASPDTTLPEWSAMPTLLFSADLYTTFGVVKGNARPLCLEPEYVAGKSVPNDAHGSERLALGHQFQISSNREQSIREAVLHY